MRVVLSIIALALCACSAQPAFFNPVMRPLPEAPQGLGPPGEYKLPSSLRVLIFPHLGPYAIPQGRESILDQVQFQSNGVCAVYDSADVQLKKPLRQGSQLLIGLNDVANPIWISCPQRTKLIRDPKLRAIEYQGLFWAYRTSIAGGKEALQVVQHLKFEEYIKGVVPAEMPASWNLEALKAQAIAARTYAAYQVYSESNEARTRNYDIDDTVYYQAYLGLSYQQASSSRAVDETQGMVMLYKGTPIIAFFSADSGGYTETAENVWKVKTDYCLSRPEVYDLSLIKTDWSYQTTLSEIEQELRDGGWLKGKAKLTSIAVSPKSVNQSGRVMEIQLGFSDGTSRPIWGPEFQMLVNLKSNMIQIFTKGEIVRFDGRGFGHGVGMNQSGARILAERNAWTYDRILNFYYTNVDL